MTPEYIAARLSHFTKEMAIFRHTMDEFNQAWKEMVQIPSQVQEMKKDITELKEYVNQLLQNQHNISTKTTANIDSLNTCTSALTLHASKQDKKYEELNEHVGHFIFKFCQVEDRLKWFEDFKNQVLEMKNDTAKSLFQFDLFSASLQDQIQKIDQKQLKTDAKIEENRSSNLVDFGILNDSFGKAHNLIFDVKSSLDSFQNSFQISLSSLSDRLERFISQNPSNEPKINEVINSMSLLKNDISKQMNDLKLEAQNATLRTTNGQTQIQIIEKKIENILLNLKKIELAKSNE